MLDAREPYLVQVDSIVISGKTPDIRKTWLNIYYITRICEAPKSSPYYKAGARWYAMLTSGIDIWMDDDDCEKIITNINESY